MDVKRGYRKTDVGVFPEDWGIDSLGSLFTFSNGVNADKQAYGKGLRFVNVLEAITYSHLYGPEIAGRVLLPDSVAAAYAVKRGDVLFNRTSETDSDVGLATTYLGAEHVVFGGFVIRGRPTGDRLDETYSGYALRAPTVRSQIVRTGQGAIRANIGQASLRSVLAPIPPKGEQRAIAAALSDVDALLDRLDRLIAKKRDLKHAAMQELLTGQTRLPGFCAEWDAPTLGELFSFKNGLNKAKRFFGYGTPIVNYMDVYEHRGLRVDDIRGRVSVTREELHAYDVHQGDVFFTRTSETADEVGIASVMLEEPEDAVFSGFVLRARPRDASLDDRFKVYCFSTSEVRRQITSQSTETTRALTNGRSLSRVMIARPKKDEQAAIAAVLSDMDAEIAGLQARRAKTRDLRQGMMQELLTGKTRLV